MEQQPTFDDVPAADHVALRGKRILVLEDDDRLYHALTDSLQDVGCEILGSCERVCDPMDTVPSSHLDAALIDLDPLSKLRMADLAQRLTDRGVPMLLITAQLAGDLPRALRTHRQLLKPFTERELLDGMVQTLGGTEEELRR